MKDILEFIVAFVVVIILLCIITLPFCLIHEHYFGYEATIKKYHEKTLLTPTDLNKCIYDNLKVIDKDIWLNLKHPEESIIRKCTNLGSREPDPRIVPMPIIIPSR